MGNGFFLKMIDCCKTKGDYHQGDIEIEKNNLGNEKEKDLLKRDSNANKNDQNIIKTGSKNSSKIESIKNEEEEEEQYGKTPPPLQVNSSKQLNINNEKNKIIPYERNIKSIDNKKYNKNIFKFNNEPDDTKLILSGELFYNKEIEIDKNGMKNGLREINDRVALFGVNNGDEKDNNDIYFCDFFLNLKKVHGNENIFKIYFDNNTNNYILYFIHNSLILYYKINDNIYLDVDRDYFIILGDIFLSINIEQINQNEKKLNIQIEIENEKSRNYSFKQNEMPIKIGRMNCTINIEKNSISKTHCFIYFENNTFFYKDAQSTNGSSLLIREDDYIRIRGEMNFKLEDCSFKIKEIPLSKKV